MYTSRETDMEQIFAFASYLANRAHLGQLDKACRDYYGHLKRVADSLDGYELKTIAMLHDIVEDTWVTEDLLRKLFTKNICDAVVTLTRKDDESYGEYIGRIISSQDTSAMKVKIADLNDNLDLSRLPSITENDLNRAAKYAKAKARLAKALSDIESERMQCHFDDEYDY